MKLFREVAKNVATPSVLTASVGWLYCNQNRKMLSERVPEPSLKSGISVVEYTI